MLGGIVSGIGSAIGLYDKYKDVEEKHSSNDDKSMNAHQDFKSFMKANGAWSKYKRLSKNKRKATWNSYMMENHPSIVKEKGRRMANRYPNKHYKKVAGLINNSSNNNSDVVTASATQGNGGVENTLFDDVTKEGISPVMLVVFAGIAWLFAKLT